ncbi:TPA: hypothetical protein ACKPYW_002282 [Pseudomonas aeruginosa]
MKRRNWKNAQPTNLRQALEWCKDHGRERRRLSVERIAEQMGLPDHSALYKWLANGRMPAVLKVAPMPEINQEALQEEVGALTMLGDIAQGSGAKRSGCSLWTTMSRPT